MPSLLFLLVFSVISSKGAISQKLYIVLRSNDETFTIADKGVYQFTENERASMDCVLDCSACLDENYYILHFYLDGNGISKIYTVKANSTVKLSSTFTLHKNAKEIICNATYLDFHNGSPNGSIVKLQLLLPNRQDNPRKGKQNPPRFESPKISPGVFTDTGARTAVFTCSAVRYRLALLSWHQMKGTERILLKAVSPSNYSSGTLYNSTLYKNLLESDRDTGLYCVARYFLDGPQLSDRVVSKRISLAFNRRVEATSEDPHVPQNTGSLALSASMGSVAIVSLIVVIVLVTVILKYRKKVNEFKRYEALRNRQPLLPPQTSDNFYEPVYGHGAGLKRPKVTPKVKPKVTQH
ncbi:uncharacterized protein LOC125226626 isoform X2 [Leguminivora glycinivorella]|uniref:uncharacterized protein LOC125226626 isoform X2 n=1 Tax=Leguminivora glycinivorella TaxID=1035111 RepID=UPI00200BBAAD|nr:uncharacterized protein LOC125226626 isoform X2 [Leguminivora glycinivorella]